MTLKRVQNRRSDALTHVGWQQMESLLASYYRTQGYEVDHSGTGGTGARFDGGIDLKLRRAGEYVLVQVKHWNAMKVPHNDVHQLLGLLVNEGATGAILVTSGEFTKAAIEAAGRQGHVQLIDGGDLRSMLGDWSRASGAVPRVHDLDALWKRGAIDVSRHVGERLLRAGGLTGDAYTRMGRSTASATRSAMLGKLGFLIVLMLVLIVGGSKAINQILSHMSEQLAQPPPRTASPALPVANSDGNKKLRRDASGPAEITDGPASGPSAAELREQNRRADEAARIIEASTPEM